MQDVIGAAIGGREAGLVFEGDRRFPIVVRLPRRSCARNAEALKQPAGAVAASDEARAPSRMTIPLQARWRIV